MSIELEDRGKALEDEYFRRQEKELLEKMKAKLQSENSGAGSLKCPKNCEANLKEIDFESVKIDVCDECGGVWLDAGELAQLLHKDEDKSGWFSRLFN